ncbi:MAG: hypothetical protein WCN87_03475 [Chlamydiota bacterium]|jgi:hypothetical protein
MAKMQLARKALYNALKYHHPLDAEEWQQEDLRLLSLEQLFARLGKLGCNLDKDSFCLFAEEVDSPEDFADDLIEDPKKQDQIFLPVFEIWRRLLPLKPSFSLIADELDEQIHCYNAGIRDERLLKALHAVLIALQSCLDKDLAKQDCQDLLETNTAYDVEGFLYEYIQESLDENQIALASDLLEAFEPFIKDAEWFSLLQLRILFQKDPEEAEELLKDICFLAGELQDPEFYLEILGILAAKGDKEIFLEIAEAALPLLETEDQLQELLSSLALFWSSLDKDHKEEAVLLYLEARKNIPLDRALSAEDQKKVRVFLEA